jgi:hypothetical protein
MRALEYAVIHDRDGGNNEEYQGPISPNDKGPRNREQRRTAVNEDRKPALLGGQVPTPSEIVPPDQRVSKPHGGTNCEASLRVNHWSHLELPNGSRMSRGRLARRVLRC